MSSSTALIAEFTTVDAVLRTNGTTSRVDAFSLTWIKAEKQLRRLFTYVVFRSPRVTKENRDQYVAAIIKNNNLSFDSLIKYFDFLSPTSLETMVGPEYAKFKAEIKRIQGYRNKIFHGQQTGFNRSALQLESDINLLRGWIETVAQGCRQHLGYDGVGRNTFRRAKSQAPFAITSYPFADLDEFVKWLPRRR